VEGAKIVAAMTPITLQMPDDVFAALRRSPEDFAREMRLAAAVHWYSRGEVSQEKAAEIVGLNRKEFLLALAREKVDVFLVDFDDLKREIDLG
jgi:predicted HTH domain antitoxin